MGVESIWFSSKTNFSLLAIKTGQSLPYAAFFVLEVLLCYHVITFVSMLSDQGAKWSERKYN